MKMDLGLTLAFVISAGYSWLDLPLSATFCHFLPLSAPSQITGLCL
jgi:hypothetical protein